MANYYSQNFDALNDGELSGQDSFSGDNGGFSVGAAYKYDGTKGCQLITNSGTWKAISRTITTASGDIIVGFWVNPSILGTADHDWFHFYFDFYNGATVVTGCAIGSETYIELGPAVGPRTDSNVAQEANVWQFIECELDFAAHTIRVRRDGGTWSSTVAFKNNENQATIIKLWMYGESTYTGMFDDISIDDVAVGPVNLKTLNGLAKASVKTINGLAIASVKSFNGLT